LETPALRFGVDGKHFETELFESDDNMTIMRFPRPSFPQTGKNPKNSPECG